MDIFVFICDLVSLYVFCIYLVCYFSTTIMTINDPWVAVGFFGGLPYNIMIHVALEMVVENQLDLQNNGT